MKILKELYSFINIALNNRSMGWMFFQTLGTANNYKVENRNFLFKLGDLKVVSPNNFALSLAF